MGILARSTAEPIPALLLTSRPSPMIEDQWIGVNLGLAGERQHGAEDLVKLFLAGFIRSVSHIHSASNCCFFRIKKQTFRINVAVKGIGSPGDFGYIPGPDESRDYRLRSVFLGHLFPGIESPHLSRTEPGPLSFWRFESHAGRLFIMDWFFIISPSKLG